MAVEIFTNFLLGAFVFSVCVLGVYGIIGILGIARDIVSATGLSYWRLTGYFLLFLLVVMAITVFGSIIRELIDPLL